MIVLIMLLVEIIKNGNYMNNILFKDILEIFVMDGERFDDILMFEIFKVFLYFLCFSEILMKILYFIVCMCLVILLFMIVKFFVL